MEYASQASNCRKEAESPTATAHERVALNRLAATFDQQNDDAAKLQDMLDTFDVVTLTVADAVAAE
jgi:hypothetical protein